MSGERHSDPLHELAQRCGVALSYEAIGGETRYAAEEDLRSVLAAMGVDASDAAACRRSLRVIERERERILDPVIVVAYSSAYPLKIEARIPASESQTGWMYELVLEGGLTLCERITDADFLHAHEGIAFDGQTYVLRYFQIEEPVPPGYHRLRIYREDSLQYGSDPGECLLISHPDQCFEAEPARGVAIQLYALRSEANSGSGEFADLADLGPWFARHDYRVAAISPVHAGFPANPRHCSPYSPSHRAFANPACIAPRRVAGGDAAALGSEGDRRAPGDVGGPGDQIGEALEVAGEAGPFIDYIAAHRRRFDALERLFARFQAEDLGAG